MVSKKQRNTKTCLLAFLKQNRAGSWSVGQWYGSADPDPYQYVTDPELLLFGTRFGSFRSVSTVKISLNFCYQVACFSKLRIFINGVIQDMILQYLKQDPDSRSRTQHNTDEIQNEYEIPGILYKLVVTASRFFH
jgi:hypothetical protein